VRPLGPSIIAGLSPRRNERSKLAGISMPNSTRPPARAAAMISSRDAAGLPKAMLSATEPENKKPSCVIITHARRRSASAMSRRSTPSSRTTPLVGS